MASKANDGRRIPWRWIGWSIPVLLLLIPLLADAPWTASDFVVAGTIFAIVGGAFELAVRTSGDRFYRAGAAVALGTAFLLVWINLAVGIIGNEDNPLNLMFFGVILIAIAGAIIARFQARGMAVAMTVAAALQALIGIVVFALDIGAAEPPGALGLLALIEGLAALWLLSAWLFRKAAGTPAKML
jgi:hypothetical protein